MPGEVFLTDEDIRRHKERKKQRQNKHRRRRRRRLRSRFSLGRLLIVLVVVLLLVFVGSIISHKQNTKNKEEASRKAKEEQTTIKQDGGSLVGNTDEEIGNLINSYFASKTVGDTNALSTVVDVLTEEDVKRNQKELELIEGYYNIAVMTKEGLDDNSRVCYVYYDLKIKNIDTVAPGSVVLYVEKNEAGTWKVHTYTNDSTIKEYIEHLQSDEDVQGFYTNVEQKLVAACDADEKLKSFYQSLTGAQ